MIAARSTSLAADSRGSVAVEFAMLAPAFFLMLFGVLQVGLGLQNYNDVKVGDVIEVFSMERVAVTA